jgi:hypothetical protein
MEQQRSSYLPAENTREAAARTAPLRERGRRRAQEEPQRSVLAPYTEAVRDGGAA